jgi:hypothetical protein
LLMFVISAVFPSSAPPSLILRALIVHLWDVSPWRPDHCWFEMQNMFAQRAEICSN